MTNLSIISPEKFTVGFQKREDYLLAFATYKDKKGKLAKEKSFNTWIDHNIALKEYTNSPLEGFKLHSLTQRSRELFGSGRHVWRVEDPRGFILEISSENLQAIIETSSLKESVICSPCVWAWSGQYLSLIPINSDLYKDTISNKERHQKKVSKKDVKIGNILILKDGSEVIYYGRWWILEKDHHADVIVKPVEIIQYYREYDKKWYFTYKSKLEIAEIKDSKENLKSQDNLFELVKQNRMKVEYHNLAGVLAISKKPIKLSDYYKESDLLEEDYKLFNFNYQIKQYHSEKVLTIKTSDEKYLIFYKSHITKYGNNIDPGYIYFYGFKINKKEKNVSLEPLKSSDYYQKGDFYANQRIYKSSDLKKDQYYYHWNKEKYLNFDTEENFHNWIKKHEPKKCYLEIEGDIINL